MKQKLLAILFSPTVVEFIVSKVFKKKDVSSIAVIENALNSIKITLIEQKMKFYKTQNPYDEEALNYTVSTVKDFIQRLNRILEDVENEPIS